MHDGDLREQILDLEARIEKLAEEIESCRKIILISKAFTAVGGILIVAMTIAIVQIRSYDHDWRVCGCHRRYCLFGFQLEHIAAGHGRPESR